MNAMITDWHHHFGQLRSLLHGPQHFESDHVPHHTWRMRIQHVISHLAQHHHDQWMCEGVAYASQFKSYWQVPLIFSTDESLQLLWQQWAPFAYIPSYDKRAIEDHLHMVLSINVIRVAIDVELGWMLGTRQDRPMDIGTNINRPITDLSDIWFREPRAPEIAPLRFEQPTDQVITVAVLVDMITQWELVRRRKTPFIDGVSLCGIEILFDGSWVTRWQ